MDRFDDCFCHAVPMRCVRVLLSLHVNIYRYIYTIYRLSFLMWDDLHMSL